MYYVALNGNPRGLRHSGGAYEILPFLIYPLPTPAVSCSRTVGAGSTALAPIWLGVDHHLPRVKVWRADVSTLRSLIGQIPSSIGASSLDIMT